MVTVKIRIESYRDVDPYLRYHGKAIDQRLDRRFWETQPDKKIGAAGRSFTHEQTVDLPAGSHYIIYGISTYPGYEWHAKIYINGTLKAEGDVHIDKQLRADFTVGVPPPPPPGMRLEQNILEQPKIIINVMRNG